MTDWLQQTGYVRLWERVHRADEASIMSHSVTRVIAEARFDERIDTRRVSRAAKRLRPRRRRRRTLRADRFRSGA